MSKICTTAPIEFSMCIFFLATKMDDLPFRLVDITEEELMSNLYVDQDDDETCLNLEPGFENIPSDSDSFVGIETPDAEDDFVDENDIDETFFIDQPANHDSDDEPLSVIREKLMQQKYRLNRSDYIPPTWSKTNSPLEYIKEFTSICGVPDFIKSQADHSPGALFQLFFSDDFFDFLVFQTNLYCQQSEKPYYPTNRIELKTFLGINLLMGIKNLPSYRDYWSSQKELNDPYISSLMPVKRFSWFLTNLHISDKSLEPKRDDPDFDKLYKVRPLLDHLSQKFNDCFLLSQNVSIDESMIKFKGRSTIKQYMPKKPIKRGYKVWVLADQSGYCSKFDLYTGKTGDVAEKNLGSRVVQSLAKGLENKGHHLYFDNYFNNVPLLETLQSKEIYASGTINPIRKYMPVFRADRNMKQGEFDYSVSNKGLLAIKWKDKRCVNLLSNYHRPDDTSSVKRKNKDGHVDDVPCPKLLIDYNKYMNGVDKFDQNKGTYEINRKSRKWWHRIFFYFVDASVVNAYVIYRHILEENSKPLSMKDFRLEIIRKLIREPSRKRLSVSRIPVTVKKHRRFVPKEVRLKDSSHQPTYTSRRRCALCSTKAKQIRTNWMCSRCDVPLCLGKNKTCFERYHSV